MDEHELLNFNYPLLTESQIQVEHIVKQQIRDEQLNKQIKIEVPRYSDKYISTISYEDVLKNVDKELMSSEIQKIQGFYCQNVPKVIVNDIEENENHHSVSEEETEEMSLGGGDDYEQNYYDEDDQGDAKSDVEEAF